jgi:hypothetical protein
MTGATRKVAVLAMWAVATIAEACPGSPVSSASDATAVGQTWLGGRFVYAFSPDVAADPDRVATFEAGCRQLLETTALACTPRSAAPDAPDYVYVIDGGHDFSWIGRQGGCQVLSILSWNNPIIVAHEIKHALGWAHEQQHPDRNHHIEVDFDAVPARNRAEFRVRDLGNEGPYDFESIMHFQPSDFARPRRIAFRPRPGHAAQAAIAGQRRYLSETDVAEIRAVYGAAVEESANLRGVLRE